MLKINKIACLTLTILLHTQITYSADNTNNSYLSQFMGYLGSYFSTPATPTAPYTMPSYSTTSTSHHHSAQTSYTHLTYKNDHEYQTLKRELDSDQTLKKLFDVFIYYKKPLSLRPTIAALKYATTYIKFFMVQVRLGIRNSSVILSQINPLYNEIYQLPGFINGVKTKPGGQTAVDNFMQAYQDALQNLGQVPTPVTPYTAPIPSTFSASQASYYSQPSTSFASAISPQAAYDALEAEIKSNDSLNRNFDNFINYGKDLYLKPTITALEYAKQYMIYLNAQADMGYITSTDALEKINRLYKKIFEISGFIDGIKTNPHYSLSMQKFKDTYTAIKDGLSKI